MEWPGCDVPTGRILRHAPLVLAAPDRPCGHPAGGVRPCAWCEDLGRLEMLRGLYREACSQRDSADRQAQESATSAHGLREALAALRAVIGCGA